MFSTAGFLSSSGAFRYEQAICKHNMNGVDTYLGGYTVNTGTSAINYDGFRNSTDAVPIT